MYRIHVNTLTCCPLDTQTSNPFWTETLYTTIQDFLYSPICPLPSPFVRLSSLSNNLSDRRYLRPWLFSHTPQPPTTTLYSQPLDTSPILTFRKVFGTILSDLIPVTSRNLHKIHPHPPLSSYLINNLPLSDLHPFDHSFDNVHRFVLS